MNARTAAVAVVALLAAPFVVVWATQPWAMTPAQFMHAVEVCRWSGGIPKPIYPEGEPMRVTRVECQL
jgi:hypothetical protein